MKKFFKLSLLILLALVSCDEANNIPNGYIPTTATGSKTFTLEGQLDVNKGYTQLTPNGCWGPLYLQNAMLTGARYDFQQVQAITRLDQAGAPDIEGFWNEQAAATPGNIYWVRNRSRECYCYFLLRVAWEQGNNVGIEYLTTGNYTSPLPVSPNANSNLDSPLQGAWGLEVPHLTAGCTYAPHYASGTREWMNLGIEWNSAYKHANWVCFTFNRETSLDKVERTDAWDVDPLLAKNDQVDNSYHTSDGFDRGHLCASEDRVYSNEANKQTFYFSNMSPQLNAFNGGYWAKMENLVQRWGRSTQAGTYDTVYVAKGGTLNHLLLNFTSDVKGNDGVFPTTDAKGFTSKGLACPAYYFMAVMAVKDGNYQALGLLVPHDQKLTKTPSAEELQTRAVSIAELEAFTGIDFFCNLPDDEEQQIESRLDISAWKW